MAQTVKNLPAMQELWVQSLSWDDPLEKGMATHSNILAWRFPWTEEPGRLQSVGRKELDTTERLTPLFLLFFFFLSFFSMKKKQKDLRKSQQETTH